MEMSKKLVLLLMVLNITTVDWDLGNFFQKLKERKKEERRRRDREDLLIICRQLHLLVILPS